MPALLKKSAKVRRKVTRRLFELSKEVYRLSGLANGRQKTVVFIVGCQRSGTNLMEHILGRDWQTRSYGESSELTSRGTRKFRLNPLPAVEEIIGRDSASIIVVRPLVESQNIVTLLNYFQDSKALWMYRHYKDVAASNIKGFGLRNGIKDLRPLVHNEQQNWRAEHVPEAVRATVLTHFSDEMNPYDAASLFWFVRNSFFFELSLDRRSDVMMCKYEDLVINPRQMVGQIYKFLNHPFPGDRVVSNVYTSSVGRGESIELSPEIEQLCLDLWKKLDNCYQTSRVVAAVNANTYIQGVQE